MGLTRGDAGSDRPGLLDRLDNVTVRQGSQSLGSVGCKGGVAPVGHWTVRSERSSGATSVLVSARSQDLISATPGFLGRDTRENDADEEGADMAGNCGQL